MTDTPIEDANACTIALHDLLERVTNPDVAIYCLIMALGNQIAAAAIDHQANAAETVAWATKLIEERVGINLEVCEHARRERSGLN